MMTSRRDILRGFSAASALSSLSSLLASDVLLSVHAASASGPPQTQATDDSAQASYDFWTSAVRSPEPGRTRSINPLEAPRAVFVFYDKQQGFVTGSDIGDAGLPDRGDLNLLVNIEQVHLSTADQKSIQHVQGGSLRIDVQQSVPLPSLPERLAWTAIAGFLPGAKNLADATQMKFDPGSTWGKLQTIPLRGGGGFWTWNFFLQHRQSRWIQLVDLMRKNASSLSPVFGFGLPAIALTALRTVDNIVAELTREASTQWLFQSPDVFVYTTKHARDSFEGTKLRLKQGMYVIVPSSQASYLAKAAAGLELKDGLIVPKNTSSLNVTEASASTVPELTYLTVAITARPQAITPQS